MTDLDALAERAITTVSSLLRKGAAIASGVLLFAASAAALCIIIAAAGLAGSARSVGLVIAIALAIVAVGTAFLARWRLTRVGTHSRELVSELRTLIDRDDKARRTVIETVETQDPMGNRSVVIWSRQFDTLRQGTQAFGEFRNLNAALVAVTSFPGLVVLSILCTVLLGGLSLIYAIAWLI
jgi:hypothetical protein